LGAFLHHVVLPSENAVREIVLAPRRKVYRAGLPRWVKNGHDAFEMGSLFYPREQTSVSYAADCDVIVCHGGAKLTDKHLASIVHCIDGEIIEWLKRRRERRRRDRHGRTIAEATELR
jgi:hypothetical protein